MIRRFILLIHGYFLFIYTNLKIILLNENFLFQIRVVIEQSVSRGIPKSGISYKQIQGLKKTVILMSEPASFKRKKRESIKGKVYSSLIFLVYCCLYFHCDYCYQRYKSQKRNTNKRGKEGGRRGAQAGDQGKCLSIVHDWEFPPIITITWPYPQ